MANSYQVTQERWEDGADGPTWDAYPILFSTIEDATARVKRDGLAAMFEYQGEDAYYHIAELAPYRDGVSYTGRQFPLTA